MQNRKPLSAAFEKIANSKKVNLDSQKVELGLVDNSRKLVSVISAGEKEFVKIAKDIDKLKNKADNSKKILNNNLDVLKDFAMKIKKAEKELGEGTMGDYFLDLQKDIKNVIKNTMSKYNI